MPGAHDIVTWLAVKLGAAPDSRGNPNVDPQWQRQRRMREEADRQERRHKWRTAFIVWYLLALAAYVVFSLIDHTPSGDQIVVFWGVHHL